MTESRTKPVDVLVVGAGLAGVSAACRLAESGLQVRLVDQALSLGGAVLRQAQQGTDRRLQGVHQAAWQALMNRLHQAGDRVEVSLGLAFSGFDNSGAAMLVHAQQVSHEWLHPQAVVLATGATERVRPRTGWTLPGVMTAGALQILMKTSLRAPQKRVVIAGSGPLLLAVGAQLTKLGQAPLALIEESNPLQHWMKSAALPWAYWREGVAYLFTLIKAGVPIHFGHQVTRIAQGDAGLKLTVQGKSQTLHLETDLVALHDGIMPNSYGMRPEGKLIWRVAGDCALGLGARASAAHGERVALDIIGLLAPLSVSTAATAARIRQLDKAIETENNAQRLIKGIYQSDEAAALRALPSDTVICRCENKTLADLQALGPNPTQREIRLVGRFAMGSCQGRFCSEWVGALSCQSLQPQVKPLVGARWPSKPISIRALTTPSPEDKRGQ